MAAIEHPYYPIIYVRGFAGTQGAIEETVATPYMGFNLGSTKVRQRWDGSLQKYVFESPLVRLMKDHGYRDVYESGEFTGKPIDARSVVVFRYYDEASGAFADAQKFPITHYAEELGRTIERVRDQVCGTSKTKRAKFRVILVAHSMGGLICRAFLQNPGVGSASTKKLVDKVFTYATPHNGIDVRLLGNVPGGLTQDILDIFNRDNMRKYLDQKGKPANSLGGKFDPQRFFCLVGTDARDYEAARGWSSRLVGPISDGLVRIENATVEEAPRAFVHRSHSGDYGIVNSEEGYQNLVRFLFGDFRADGVLQVNSITLPPALERVRKSGKEVRAGYHFETVVRVRGARWDLHRRLVSENSAIFRQDVELGRAAGAKARHPHLFTSFLSSGNWARATSRGEDVVFQVDVKMRAPEYEVDRKFRPDQHFEGAYIYQGTINLKYVPAHSAKETWKVQYGFGADGLGAFDQTATVTPIAGGGVAFDVPIVQRNDPALDAILKIELRPWNRA